MKGAFFAVITILILVIIGGVAFLIFGPNPDAQRAGTAIDFEEPFTLRIGDTITISEDHSIALQQIVSDSRCPTGTTDVPAPACVWAGTVTALLRITTTTNEDNALTKTIEDVEIELQDELHAPADNFPFRVVFLAVSPTKTAAEDIPTALYELTFAIESIPQDEEIVEEPEDLVLYFSTTLEERARERIGSMPIEGYNPTIYMNTFPILVPADFAGAAALQGSYVLQGEQILFELDDTDTIHSAAQTLSKEGMETFLENISTRLGLSVSTKTEIDNLINQIDS